MQSSCRATMPTMRLSASRHCGKLPCRSLSCLTRRYPSIFHTRGASQKCETHSDDSRLIALIGHRWCDRYRTLNRHLIDSPRSASRSDVPLRDSSSFPVSLNVASTRHGAHLSILGCSKPARGNLFFQTKPWGTTMPRRHRIQISPAATGSSMDQSETHAPRVRRRRRPCARGPRRRCSPPSG